MLTPAEIRATAFRRLRMALTDLDFRPRRSFLLRDHSSEVTDLLTLGQAVPGRTGPVQLYINVGVHCVPLQRLEAEVRMLKYEPIGTTFVVNLGYLTPERNWHEWSVPREPVRSELVLEMAAAVRECGVPFWSQYGTLASIEEGCRKYGVTELNALRLPALKHLQGDYGGARTLLAAELEARGQEQHVAAVRFRDAAKRLRQKIDEADMASGAT